MTRESTLKWLNSIPAPEPCEFFGRIILAGRCCSRRRRIGDVFRTVDGGYFEVVYVQANVTPFKRSGQDTGIVSYTYGVKPTEDYAI